MAKIPTYDTPQVASTPQPGVRVDSVATPGLMASAVQQDQEFGRSLTVAGDQAGQLALKMQEQANQLRVDDAINQAKEQALKLTFDPDQGYTNVKGVDALQRPNGVPLADDYTSKLDSSIGEISANLGNDMQRKLFAQHAGALKTQFYGQVLSHESDQFREYAMSVRDGTIKNAQNEIGIYYTDPERIDANIKSINAAVADQGRLLGKSATWIEAQTRAQTSNAHALAISAALENNDVMYADAYLKKYASQMDADDILKVRGTITKEVDARVALGTATQVMQSMQPRMQTPDSDRAFNIALNTESGGRQFGADGKPITSPKGAIGIAQVMPSTGPEAAKLAGLEWDENRFRNDPEYNRAIGKAYFDKQLKDNGGNLAMAYAAYNAGPGALQAAITKAKADGTGDWLANLPQETQAYVAKNVQAFNGGGGTNQRPSLQDVHNEIRTRLGADKPQQLKMAIDEATRQYEDQTKAIAQQNDQAVASAMQWLSQNGGRFSQLPPSLRAALPPKEIDNVMGFGQKVAKGDNMSNMAVYERLSGDQEYLKGLSDAQFYQLRGQLSEDDFKHFSQERGKLITGKTSEKPDDLNTTAVNVTLNNRLATLGLDPSPKDGSSDAQRVGAIRKFVNMSVLNAQAAVGKKFSDADVEKHIDGLFSKSVQFQNTFLGFNTSSSGMRMLSMTVGDIPSDVKDRLKADFKTHGIDAPSDADLLGAYWMLKSAQPRAKPSPLGPQASNSGATGGW